MKTVEKINSIMGKLNDKTNCIDYIKINNILSYNPSDMCNAFAEHFASIGKLCTKKFLAKKEPTGLYKQNSKISTIPLPKTNN